MRSIKCPQCGLVNFAGVETCKRCEADLTKVSEMIEQVQVAKSAAALKPNLMPCPDCDRMISRYAEACPQCGRFIQRIETPGARTAWSSLSLLSAALVVIAALLATSGLSTLYSPERIVGGDAFNYIIAGARGTGLLTLGLGVLVLGVGLDIRGEIVRSRK